jgi:outer membrane protein TolC
MIRIIVLCLLMMASLYSKSQDTISLTFLLNIAAENATLAKNNSNYDKYLDLQDRALSSGNLPQIKLFAQATYQSDVTEIDLSSLPFPIDITSPDRDQYKAVLEINQKIYDGGMAKNKLAVSKQENNINKQSLEIDIFKLKVNVTKLYFNILQVDKQIENLFLLHRDLFDKKKVVEAGIRNGILKNDDLYNIEANILQLEQQIKELKISKKTLIEYLSALTKYKISENVIYIAPLVEENTVKMNRPELALFDQQKELINSNSLVIKSTNNPKLYAFGQLGYGKPGLNFLNNEFTEYYIIGASFNWYLWDWGQNKNQRQAMEVQKDIIDIQKQNVLENLNNSLLDKRAEIEKNQAKLQTDEQIIELRKKSTKIAEAELGGGVITSWDYISVKTLELRAILDYELHKIQLAEAIMNLNIESGNF